MSNNAKNHHTSSSKTPKKEDSKKKSRNKSNSSATLPNCKKPPMRKDSKISNLLPQPNTPIIGLPPTNSLLLTSIQRPTSKRNPRSWESMSSSLERLWVLENSEQL